MLALLSSPDGTEAATFGEMKADETSVVLCTVHRCRPSDNGWVLNLTDVVGGHINAFCRYADVNGEVLNGSAVRIWTQPSDDDPSFFYISRMKVLPPPEIIQANNILLLDMYKNNISMKN